MESAAAQGAIIIFECTEAEVAERRQPHCECTEAELAERSAAYYRRTEGALGDYNSEYNDANRWYERKKRDVRRNFAPNQWAAQYSALRDQYNNRLSEAEARREAGEQRALELYESSLQTCGGENEEKESLSASASAATEFSASSAASVSGSSASSPAESAQSSDSGGSNSVLLGVGGVAAAVLAMGMWDGAPDAFSFSPQYDLSENGGGIGGRLNFAKENWRLYWTAGQTNANGEFGDLRYESGGEYRTDFWTAAFSESVQGETADYDFSLSAEFRGGIWKVSPIFAVDSRYENGEFATTNSFRISGDLRVDDWRFSLNGDTERMQLFAEHRF